MAAKDVKETFAVCIVFLDSKWAKNLLMFLTLESTYAGIDVASGDDLHAGTDCIEHGI